MTKFRELLVFVNTYLSKEAKWDSKKRYLKNSFIETITERSREVKTKFNEKFFVQEIFSAYESIPVSIVKIFRAAYFLEHLCWLLLYRGVTNYLDLGDKSARFKGK